MSNSGAGPRQPYIGGQAVIEGVMMRSPKSFVVAVRRHVGGIAIREQKWEQLAPGLKFLRWPIFRGALVLAESLHNGFSALKFSSEHGLPPEEGSKKSSISASTLLAFMMGSVIAAADSEPAPPSAPSPEPRKGGSDFMLALSTVVMMVFFIGLPHALTWLVGKAIGPSFDTTSFAFHLVDGVFRVAILVGYMFVLSKTEDAKTLFRYHGAEHKAIWTYESYKPLTVDNAKPFTTQHPRCGTSFLFIVVGVAVLMHVILLPFVPRLHPNDLVNQLLMILIKVPMAFPIAGIAYELQRWSAMDSCPRFIKSLTRPGVWLQGITTQPPTDSQQEVALLSLDRALAREEGKPKSADGVTLYGTFAEAAA
ncbi:MAG: hypothetical protein DI536_03030 [Archangium gephyra]|uniref:DUF1385 domain-containing protein n=1 Tax=Archangium gephyra TaxID=48 RepID=A0A2W5U158_9BACT|nr:MAG: hypothetical protein DI536_03030 [Archangium gephyra]